MNAGAFIDGRLSEEPAQGWSDANASGGRSRPMAPAGASGQGRLDVDDLQDLVRGLFAVGALQAN